MQNLRYTNQPKKHTEIKGKHAARLRVPTRYFVIGFDSTANNSLNLATTFLLNLSVSANAKFWLVNVSEIVAKDLLKVDRNEIRRLNNYVIKPIDEKACHEAIKTH